ncbi:type II secretion system protein GspL [Pseudomonas sp. JDS28PS106]|uniref:type II secretion system protein GspL n=1 Tax=Pseudomonas sp. JDS28PS106 TaxID=2497235 RepID=UPI002FD6D180
MNKLEALIARLRPTAGAPRGWLLVRPVAEASGWQWCCHPGGRSGDWPPPADVSRDRVALVLPAAACSHFQIPAPPGLKRHEWPLLLEDVLQQPVEQVRVECLARREGRLELLVVEQARFDQWLAECQALGMAPHAVWAEQQLLPQQLPGQALCWTRSTNDCLLRAADDGTQHWLVWPRQLGACPADWPQADLHMTGEWPSEWARLEHLPSLLGRPVVRRPRGPGRVSFTRFQRRLAGVCAGLALCWASVLAVQFWQQLPVWKAQVEAVTGPVADTRQAARALSRLQARQTDWRSRQQQVAELEAAVADWLASRPGWGVSGNYFDGRNWRLVLSGDAAASDIGHWQAMGKAVGAVANAVVDDKTSLLTVNFDLGAQP